jgi:signal transduction histidine kinase
MNPRLVTRLTAPIAFVSAVLLLIAVGAAWYVRSLQKSVSELTANHVASVFAAQELEISIREVRAQFDRFLITGDSKYLEPVPGLKKRTAEALADAEKTAYTPVEAALMRRVRQGYEHFFEEYEKAVRISPIQGVYLRIIDLTDTVLLKEILEPAHEYLRLNEGTLARSARENQEMAGWLTAGLLALGLCGSIGGLLLGWIVASTIRRSLLRTEERLWDTARQLGQAARTESADLADSNSSDALEMVSSSVSALLQRLRQSERHALQAERLAWVGQMAAGIAHEVRNPLMTIKLLVQAAADRRGGSAFQSRELQILEEEIVRLEQIVAGFLDFARPPRPALRPIDLTPLVEQSADFHRLRSDLQAVKISVVVPPEPVVILADPNQIRQVVHNLITNALDAQPGGGEVVVRLRAGEEVELAVEDAGPGLPAELGERVFEPFVSTRDSGLGLGLSICRRIVEAHAGVIRAENREGGGATFLVRLPPSAPAASRPLTQTA